MNSAPMIAISMNSANMNRPIFIDAVLGEVAGDELGLGLGQVERDALVLGDRGGEEEERARTAGRRCPRPAGSRARCPTARRTIAPRSTRAEDQDQAEHGEAHDELVGDHLRAGAQRAEQRELVRRRPAGEHRADDRQAAEREHDQQAGVEPRDLQRVGAVAEPAGERRDRAKSRPGCSVPPNGMTAKTSSTGVKTTHGAMA